MEKKYAVTTSFIVNKNVSNLVRIRFANGELRELSNLVSLPYETTVRKGLTNPISISFV